MFEPLWRKAPPLLKHSSGELVRKGQEQDRRLGHGSACVRVCSCMCIVYTRTWCDLHWCTCMHVLVYVCLCAHVYSMCACVSGHACIRERHLFALRLPWRLQPFPCRPSASPVVCPCHVSSLASDLQSRCAAKTRLATGKFTLRERKTEPCRRSPALPRTSPY